MKYVSYIVICYNTEDSIPVAISSILALRKFGDLEIVVVDDASKDGTLRTVEEFASNNPEIRIHRNQENRGRAFSRNRGLEIAKGDYVCFVDADDFVNAVYFEGIPQALVENVDVIVSGRLDFEIKSKKPFSTNHVDQTWSGWDLLTDVVNFPAAMDDNFITGKFIRRQIITENNIQFNEKRRNAEDILFSTAIWLQSTHTKFHHKPFYGYGRGNYRVNFGEEKFRDVLENLALLPTLLGSNSTYLRRELLANKYAKSLVETINRGRDAFSPHEAAQILSQHFSRDAFSEFEFLRFVNDRERKFVNACLNGEFLLAVSNVLR